MRVNEENKHLVKTNPKQLAATRKYLSNLSDEKKIENKERIKQYYLDNKEKLNTQKKINYYKKKLETNKTVEQIKLENDKKKENQKQKLTIYLEKLLL